ncbi:polyketide synthase dehydratase domain-containing protein [Pseudoroseomonas wenyumeiae]
MDRADAVPAPAAGAGSASGGLRRRRGGGRPPPARHRHPGGGCRPPPATPDFAALRERCPRLLEAATLYARLADRHIALGPQFRWLERIWLGQDEAVFEVAPPAGEAVDPAFQLHPGLLDSLLQPALAVLAMGQGNDTYVPVALEAFRFHARPVAFPLRGHVRRRGAAQDLADILVCDATDACVAEVHGFEFRRLDAGKVGAASPLDTALYAVAWDECPAPAAAAAEFPAPAVLMADDAVLRHGLDAPWRRSTAPLPAAVRGPGGARPRLPGRGLRGSRRPAAAGCLARHRGDRAAAGAGSGSGPPAAAAAAHPGTAWPPARARRGWKRWNARPPCPPPRSGRGSRRGTARRRKPSWRCWPPAARNSVPSCAGRRTRWRRCSRAETSAPPRACTRIPPASAR